jgi:hypothetical protein
MEARMVSRKEVHIQRRLFDNIGTLLGVRDAALKEIDSPDDRADFAGHLYIAGKELKVLAEIKAVGEPWAIRLAIHQLTEYQQLHPEYTPLLVAPFIGPRGRELCKEHGIWYVDLSGNCYLEWNGIYIDKIAPGNRFREVKEIKGLFSDKASLVIRAVLERPNKGHRVRELSRQLGMSPAWTSQVLTGLVKAGYAARANRETHVSRPLDLLQDWAESYDFLRRNDVYPFFCDAPTPQALISRVASVDNVGDKRYALTLHAGASLVAPFAKFHEVHIYVDPWERQVEVERFWMEELELERVERGGNLYLVWPYYKHSVFHGVREVNGVSVVSDMQLYVDLYNFPIRGREQAEHLMGRRLAYLTSEGVQT